MHQNRVKPARAGHADRRTKGRQSLQKRHLGQCAESGKVRFRDKREARDALHLAVATRRLREAAGETCRRQECRMYLCASCSGWHLTSQPLDYRKPSPQPVENKWWNDSHVTEVVVENIQSKWAS